MKYWAQIQGNNDIVETSIKFTLEQVTKDQKGNKGITLSLTSALDGVGGQRYAPAALPPGKRPGTHCFGGRAGPRAVWTGAENLASTGNPSPDRPAVASRYTDWAIPAHRNK
jgi:hypothetical protein